MAEIGQPVLNDHYTLLRQVEGSIGGPRTMLGNKGVCRYCESRDASAFRNDAHTIPEALGNRWIFSRDECDACNRKFSLYEDALVNGISPLLTLGGTKGKGNRVRQTGRSAGDNVIMREDTGLSILARSADPGEHIAFDPTSERFQFVIPVAGVRFRPRHAYKALSKVGVALLPDDELDNYRQLRAWLLDVDDNLDFPVLDVAMSFGSVGNAPPLVVASLLRRINAQAAIPHILLILCAGSVCLQIDLMSDYLEDHIPPMPVNCLNADWSVVLAGKIGYGTPTHQNWSASETTPQPIETIVLDFDTRCCVGRFTPVFRAGATSV